MVSLKIGAPPVSVVLASLILWVSFAWGLPAEAPAAEGEAEVAAEDPWAGVKISGAYDYAKCLNCGEKNEVQAESCAQCAYSLPQPSGEYTYPPWVFVPGKGYYREGALLEPGKSRKGLWITGFVFTTVGGLFLIPGGVVVLADGEYPAGGIGIIVAGIGATAVGIVLLIRGIKKTKPVYAFEQGESYRPYDRAPYARRSPYTEGVGLKVEVSLLSF